MIETNHFIFYFNNEEDYIEKLVSCLEQKLKLILSFFEISKINKKIKITLISKKEEFDNIFYDIHKFKPDLNSMGFYHDGEITYLSFNELNKTNHKNDSFKSYINILTHECVHFIHGYVTNDKMSLRCFNEGIALYLGKQYDTIDYSKFNCTIEDLISQKNVDYYNYYIIVDYLMKNKEKKYILEILKNKSFAINELKYIYDDLRKSFL